jgi:hypothetical protein
MSVMRVGLWFVGMLVTFHIILVFAFPLTKRGWKIVDYIWLGSAALGLIGLAGRAREARASGELDLKAEKAIASYSTFRYFLSDFSSLDGPVCRKFIRSEFSPPEVEMSVIQRRYDDACQWYLNASKSLPKSVDRDHLISILTQLQPYPMESNKVADLTQTYKIFMDGSARYEGDADSYREDLEKKKDTELEYTLVLLSPLLTSLALALRISKVTAEIREIA